MGRVENLTDYQLTEEIKKHEKLSKEGFAEDKAEAAAMVEILKEEKEKRKR